jgi:hypothetical protein
MFNRMEGENPIVIGASGGSGTRAVARILMTCGIFMGERRNGPEDALDFVEFYDRWAGKYLSRMKEPMRETEEQSMRDDFLSRAHRHRSKHELWGWKNPRSILFLPFLRSVMPGLRFIHLIRDGRDMAFSANQLQLEKHENEVLNESEKQLPLSHRSITFWQRVNLAAADFGEKEMDGDYLRIRFEHLCAQPEETIGIIMRFIDTPLETHILEPAIAQVAPPESIGRWKGHDSFEIESLERLAAKGLERFGYLQSDR